MKFHVIKKRQDLTDCIAHEDYYYEHKTKIDAHLQNAGPAPSPIGQMPPNDGMPGGPMPPNFFVSLY